MADIIALGRGIRRLLQIRNNRWRLRDRDDPLEMEERNFINSFRLSKMAVKDLVDELRPHQIETESSGGYSLEMQVLSSLYVLGSGSFQHVASASSFAQISQTSVSRFLKKIVDCIHLILPSHIQFPTTASELMRLKEDFYSSTGFPNCVGAIDCSHFNIVRPAEPDYFVFMNRKSRFSVNVQMVCDFNLKILDVVARWPGSIHDSFIWRGSSLRDLFLDGFIPVRNFLLGDSGYPLEPWLMIPLSKRRHSKGKKYNEVHCKARNVIERCFGVLKSRFRYLHETGGILQYTPEKVCQIITACAVLHNICVKYNVSSEEYDELNSSGDEDDSGDGDADPNLNPISNTLVSLRDKASRFREEISVHF